ncbi:hypothetical protein, partial [Parasphingorhabdus sp.]|uniref:hypothetical protein n=1 Tax=Parasphingorhabdus sp. TaxID=2709688 RepID=UPI003298F589
MVSFISRCTISSLQTPVLNKKEKLVQVLILILLTNLLVVPQSVEGKDQLSPEPVPVESYAALPFLHSPSLSPDGTKLAVLVTKGDAKHVGIIDLSAPKESGPKYYSIGDTKLNWFHWAGNKQLLVSFGSARNLIFFVYSTNTLKTIDLETSKITSLNEKSEFIKDNIIFRDPYGRYIIAYQYRRGKPYAVRIDLSDASEVVLEKPRHQIDQWISDNKGNIRAGINYSKKRWRLYYREQPGGELVKIENRRYDSFEDGVVEDLQFLPETGQAIILTNGKNGRFGAYNYNIREDIIGEAIYEHPTADVTNLVMDSAKNLIGVEYDADKPGQK